jgi:hypothetical protein
MLSPQLQTSNATELLQIFNQGSRPHSTLVRYHPHGHRSADMSQPNDPIDPKNDPSSKQSPEDAEGRPAAAEIDKDDPHKVEKLSKLGHAGDEAAEGTE